MSWMNDDGGYEKGRMAKYREMTTEELHREMERYQRTISDAGSRAKGASELWEWNIEKINKELDARSPTTDIAGLIWEVRDKHA